MRAGLDETGWLPGDFAFYQVPPRYPENHNFISDYEGLFQGWKPHNNMSLGTRTRSPLVWC